MNEQEKDLVFKFRAVTGRTWWKSGCFFVKPVAQKQFVQIADAGISTYCITELNKESPGVVSLGSEDGNMVNCKFVSFSDEINHVLSAADLVISRARTGSIAEGNAMCCRVPSILVPYPYAAENHQQLNASFLEGKGACVVCMQDKIDNDLMEEKEMMFNEELRGIMRRNLFALDPGDVGGKIALDIRDCLQTFTAKGE